MPSLDPFLKSPAGCPLQVRQPASKGLLIAQLNEDHTPAAKAGKGAWNCGGIFTRP
jgi:hypothetical protein